MPLLISVIFLSFRVLLLLYIMRARVSALSYCRFRCWRLHPVFYNILHSVHIYFFPVPYLRKVGVHR